MLQWNSVDVLGGDAIMRLGHVIDVGDGGLVIDFLCPNRRRELVPFDRVFISDRNRCLDEQKLDSCRRFGQYPPVDILMRESVAEPWTWFPGQIFSLVRSIHYFWYDEVVVRWGHAMEHTDVVPLWRIRWTLHAYRRTAWADQYEHGTLPEGPERVTKCTFGKLCLRLPESHSPEEAAAALKRRSVKLECSAARAVGVAVVDGCVLYILRRPVGESRIASETVDLHSFHNRLSQYISWMPVPPSNIQTAAQGHGVVLPTELFTELFSCLDTVTQTKIRIVCATCNAILEQPVLAANIVLVSTARQTASWMPGSLLTLVFKRLSASTQRIILTDRERCLKETHILKLLDMIHFVVQRNARIRLRTIHLYGVQFSLMIGSRSDTVASAAESSACKLHRPREPSRSYSVNLADFISACSHLQCRSIQLTRCTIKLMYTVSLPKRRDRILDAPIHITQRLPGDGDVGSAVLVELLAGLPAITDEQWQRLNGIFTQESPETVAAVCQVLCATQSVDPRPFPPYRGKKFCVEGMENVRLEALSLLALHSIFQLVTRGMR